MRWGSFEKIWRGIMAAEAAGLTPIKLNSVVTAGYNESDVIELARLTLERDWHVRFIELMPLGGGECATLSMERYVSNIETRRRIETALGALTEIPSENAADESRNYRLAGARGVVGFISPVSEPYCGTCNRMRLTADGKFHLCLLNDDELDVRKAMRSNSGDVIDDVARILIARGRVEAHRASPARRPLDAGPLDVPNRRLSRHAVHSGGQRSSPNRKIAAAIIANMRFGIHAATTAGSSAERPSADVIPSEVQ